MAALYRHLDPAYLQNDFFVNSTEEFGGRSAFVKLVGVFCHFMALPYAALLLTWLSHVLISVATYWTAYNLFGRSRIHAMVAATMVLSVNSTALSQSCILQARLLVPFLVALPGALFAIGFALRGRPVSCLVASCLGALAHPAALQAGLIGLCACALSSGHSMLRGARVAHRNPAREFAIAVACAFLLALVIYAFWVLPYEVTLSAAEIRNMYAYFRVPGHLVPSMFGLRDWSLFLLFLAATGYLWLERWRRSEEVRDQLVRGAFVTVIVLLICVAGYVGVEWIPVRMVIVSSTYRLIFIIKWIGLILIGGYLVDLFGQSRHLEHKLPAVPLFLASGILQPAWVFASCFVETVRIRIAKAGHAHSAKPISLIATSVLLVAVYAYRDSEEFHALLISVPVLVWFLGVKNGVLRCTIPIVGCVALALAFSFGRAFPDTATARLLEGHQPIITLAEDADEPYMLGQYIKNNLPKDAVFVVTPQGLRLRLTGERAVVVDGKAFPFNDNAIREWHERMLFCYGTPATVDLTLMDQLATAYASISDAHLRRIRDRYGATHAILFKNTATKCTVIIESERYKVVEIR